MNEDFKTEEPLVSTQPEAATFDTPSEKSLLDKLIPKFDFKIPKEGILIPIGLVVFAAFVGIGGTYMFASSVLKPEVPAQEISQFDETDVPSFNGRTTLRNTLPTPTLFVPTSAPTSVPATPTPTTAQTANWTSYNFSAVFLNFSYPPGWFTNVAATSGAPYMYVQNYPVSSTPPVSTSGNFSIYIGRLEQVGITTIAQLQTQLALNAANSTYIGTANMGTTTVLSSNPITINGYQALERTITYSAFPSVQYFEVYVLDGVSNAIRFAPQIDITGTIPYLNLLLSTIKFTN
ncbi:MAG: hypothetical protein KA035_02690 [Candidatus Levybacteria bacterium]|nr:hypothetical protein [Candidatus Levybacteria bacterium]